MGGVLLMKKLLGIRIDVWILITVFLVVGVALKYRDYIHPLNTGTRTLDSIKRSGELVILTQNMPTTYFLDRDGNEAGPEYEIVKEFADHLGVTPRFIIKHSVEELLMAVEAGKGDLASGGLTVTEARKKRFLYGPRYQEVNQQVVCRRGGPTPKNIKDLYKVELDVSAGTSYAERLAELKTQHTELKWAELKGVDSEEILIDIWKGERQCTVMDSTIVAVNQRYLPELKVMFNLGEKEDLAWVLPKDAADLRKVALDWFSSFKKTERYAGIKERYFGHVEGFDYVDTAAFIRRIEERYTKYRPLFQTAAETYELSELLLASQSYQESHWNPKAKSQTGVRGMMMLTLPTAKAMEVTNRLNPEQSIMGGAKYLAKLKDGFRDTIEEPDLTWISLAAYNVGLGHVKDAQKLAVKQNKNPNKWHDLKEVLPLLSKKSYYKDLYYGYARGNEPVRYVTRIREYEQILSQQLEIE